MNKLRPKDEMPFTQLSLIRRAAASDPAIRKVAIAAIVNAYDLPSRHFWRKLKVSQETATEILQAFVTERIVEKGILAKFDHTRGRFRSFLIKAIYNYAVTWLKKSQMDQGIGLDRLNNTAEPVFEDPVLKKFDREWGREVLRQAIDSMHDECRRKSRSDIWEIFAAKFVEPTRNGAAEPDYTSMVEQFGLKKPRDAINLMVTGLRMYKRHLAQTIGKYASTDKEIEEELFDLRKAFD